MGWKQLRPFYLSKMGTRPNYCLQNVRLAYDIPPKYADAKSAMNASKKQGTFHEEPVPSDIDVPLFADTGSPYGHVMVCSHGDVYSDGKYMPSLPGMRILGWSETLNDVRIVEYVEEPAPAPEPTPEPTPEPEFKVGDNVVPINLVDYDGTPVVQYDDYYTISQINGDRAVLTAPRNGVPTVWCAMNTNNIRKV